MTKREKIENGVFAAVFIVGLPLAIAAARLVGS